MLGHFFHGTHGAKTHQCLWRHFVDCNRDLIGVLPSRFLFVHFIRLCTHWLVWLCPCRWLRAHHWRGSAADPPWAPVACQSPASGLPWPAGETREVGKPAPPPGSHYPPPPLPLLETGQGAESRCKGSRCEGCVREAGRGAPSGGHRQGAWPPTARRGRRLLHSRTWRQTI